MTSTPTTKRGTSLMSEKRSSKCVLLTMPYCILLT